MKTLSFDLTRYQTRNTKLKSLYFERKVRYTLLHAVGYIG